MLDELDLRRGHERALRTLQLLREEAFFWWRENCRVIGRRRRCVRRSVELWVRLHVLLVRFGAREALVAVLAHACHCDVVIVREVCGQRLLVDEPFRARAALERVLRRVIRQVVLTRERLAADVTDVWTMAGVKPRVALQIRA